MKTFWDTMKSRMWRFVRIAVVVAVIAAVAYAIKFAPITVESHMLTRGPIVAEVMGTGTLEAYVEATISPITPIIRKVPIADRLRLVV